MENTIFSLINDEKNKSTLKSSILKFLPMKFWELHFGLSNQEKLELRVYMKFVNFMKYEKFKSLFEDPLYYMNPNSKYDKGFLHEITKSDKFTNQIINNILLYLAEEKIKFLIESREFKLLFESPILEKFIELFKLNYTGEALTILENVKLSVPIYFKNLEVSQNDSVLLKIFQLNEVYIEKLIINQTNPIVDYLGACKNTKISEIKFYHYDEFINVKNLLINSSLSIKKTLVYFTEISDFNDVLIEILKKNLSIRSLRISFEYSNESNETIFEMFDLLAKNGQIQEIYLLESNFDPISIEEFVCLNNFPFKITLEKYKKDKIMEYTNFISNYKNTTFFNFEYKSNDYFIEYKSLLNSLQELQNNSSIVEKIEKVKLTIEGKKSKKILNTVLNSIKNCIKVKKLKIISENISNLDETIIQFVEDNQKSINSIVLDNNNDTFIFSLTSLKNFSLKIIQKNDVLISVADIFCKNNPQAKFTLCLMMYQDYINSMDYISKKLWINYKYLCNNITELLFYDTINEKEDDDNYDLIELSNYLHFYKNLEILSINCFCKSETWEYLLNPIKKLKYLMNLTILSRKSDQFGYFKSDFSASLIKICQNLYQLNLKGEFDINFFNEILEFEETNLDQINLQGKLFKDEETLKEIIQKINKKNFEIKITFNKKII